MNRVLAHTGAQYPIVQAPMGWIARSQLVSAVCKAGGLGIIETSSGETEAWMAEIEKMKTLTDRPFGINLPLLFLRDMRMVEFVADCGVKFVSIIRVTYPAEQNKDTGDVKVTLSGLEEINKTKSEPMHVPK